LLFGLLICSASGWAQLFEGFETNSPGLFPAQWQLLYNGAGTEQQFVDTNQAAGGAQSLHLLGSSCWSATAYKPVVLPRKLHLKMSVRVSGDPTGGCTPFVAGVGLYNATNATFGTAYGSVAFFSDGSIYLIRDGADYENTKVSLQTYTSNRWYSIDCAYDLDSHLVDVDVDGVRRATALSFSTNGEPDGVEIEAGHGISPTAWFDNVSVEENNDDLIASIHISAVDICWAGRSNQIYQVQYRTNISDTNWFNFGPPVPGTGTNCVTDRIDAQRFYRVVRPP
jgi:hypothetical protein